MTRKGHILGVNTDQEGKLSNESIRLYHDDLSGINFLGEINIFAINSYKLSICWQLPWNTKTCAN